MLKVRLGSFVWLTCVTLSRGQLSSVHAQTVALSHPVSAEFHSLARGLWSVSHLLLPLRITKDVQIQFEIIPIQLEQHLTEIQTSHCKETKSAKITAVKNIRSYYSGN